MKLSLVMETLKHALWGALVGAVLAIGAPLAFAQEENLRVVREAVGPYDVAVVMSPAVPSLGDAHFTITVLEASSGEPVADAQVKILAQGPEGNRPGWAWALNRPVTPDTYTAGLNLEAPGLWHIAVEVRSDLGEGTLEMSLQVPGAQRIRRGALIWAIVVAVFAWGFFLIWRSARRTGQRRQGSP